MHGLCYCVCVAVFSHEQRRGRLVRADRREGVTFDVVDVEGGRFGKCEKEKMSRLWMQLRKKGKIFVSLAGLIRIELWMSSPMENLYVQHLLLAAGGLLLLVKTDPFEERLASRKDPCRGFYSVD
ncbi:hypothetical protein C2S51_010749 [Perilla frutescens var. frutescens]|nr:hypothetical protein C2S51_010749 [Perilla frutescens var. frutescens]